MKKVLCGFALVCVLSLTVCGGSPKVGESHDGEADNCEGVTMTVVEDTATPSGITVEVLNGTMAEISSGNERDFALQIQRDGQWCWLETGDTFVNTTEAYSFTTGEPRELTFTWASRYGSLEPGHYRAAKRFFERRAPGGTTDFLLTAEFTLE